ncbi:MAG: YigZ family protein [Balneolales bacterium]|nr:YigZ family protein [Balneolales bacterium]
MNSTDFNTISGSCTADYRILGSKFLAFGFACECAKTFAEQLASIKKLHHSATHHCYAWRMNPHEPEEFSQDDGEPSGTAGLPILNELRSRSLINCAVVVVRYYGGTKLGKPGLIDAYGRSAALCLDEAGLLQLQPGIILEISCGYPVKKQVDYLVTQSGAHIEDAVYTEEVSYTVHAATGTAPALLLALEKLNYLGVSCRTAGEVLITEPL